MKARLLIAPILIASMAILFAWGTIKQGVEAKSGNVVMPDKASTSHTIRLNLGTTDPIIDPALSVAKPSLFVVEQLFLGLTQVDNKTDEPIPALATSWEMSPDAQVFTFTLRSDATWTNGSRVTAYDVRYGILRSLDPATASDYAYVLYVIRNAEAYNTGLIFDPNQIGVTVLDDVHIRFDLEKAAAYLPSILALPVAYAMPAAVIAAHPNDWTEPNNIVTNGPYKLTNWAHGTSMSLQKNSNYYDAASVQIDKVLFSMVDDVTAWDMYLAGQLDSVIVPHDQWNIARSEPLLQQELYSAPIPCTYYYGFNTAKAPFNDVNVRKAFVASVNRQGIIKDVPLYGDQPALTFTSPGILGHVDGYAEDVGIPYNPVQAKQWLADAGYPNGQGLPEITLMYNTSPGQQAIAEVIRQGWMDNLGVTVTLSDMSWKDYLSLLQNDPPQVWRLGWCADYRDAYNFLYDALVGWPRVSFGNWNNSAYDDLLAQAAQTADVTVRKSLYRQAEKILVETDAVMIPIYYYVDGVITKPYLERTYESSTGGYYSGYIAKWRITREGTIVGTNGGTLTSYDGNTTIEIPAGAVTDTIVITHTPSSGMPPDGNLTTVGHVFDVTAVYSSTGQLAQLATGSVYTITVQYSDVEKGSAIENTLALYYWDGSQWLEEATSVTDTTTNTVMARPNHLSLWAVLGETHRIYLPLLVR